MKHLTILIIVIALILVIFNGLQLDFNAPFKGDSIIALITIIASSCAIVLMLILRTSKRIEKKIKSKKRHV